MEIKKIGQEKCIRIYPSLIILNQECAKTSRRLVAKGKGKGKDEGKGKGKSKQKHRGIFDVWSLK